MKISLQWLSDYIDLKDYFSKPQALGEILTRAGLEVEDLQNPSASLDHVVIGHILEKDRHPNADKLSLCRVSIGSGKIEQIVCGAQNHKAGDRVIVALPGAVLPGNFAIKKSNIRGVDSNGMLCSLKELGQAQSADGIAILAEDAPVGASYADYAGLNDVIFELKVTPNRADCLSHYGLARELSALLGRPLVKLEPKITLSSESTRKAIQVEVKAQDLCPRYTGRVIRNIKVQASPDWLRQRLEKVGLSSINNVVDVTNYVMMELGQPLHAFDFSQIQKQHLIIARAMPQEKFTSLDGTILTLAGEELTIRDVERPLCIAGTIGGKNSGVTEKTTDLFLESAYFLPMSVRKTSRNLGANTDSAYRFSRGVDPRGTLMALERATELILKFAGGEALAEPYDLSVDLPERPWIAISAELISDRLGYAVSMAEARDCFRKLNFEIKDVSASTFQVKGPSYRFDIEQDMDLVEEYARIYGYDRIPETVPSLIGTPSPHDPKYLLARQIAMGLKGMGFSQAWNFAFVSGQKESQFFGDGSRLKATGLTLPQEKIKVMNPLNEELNVMRSFLSFGLLQNILSNYSRGNHSGRLFETGSTFVREQSGYGEKNRLALAAWGFSKNLWDSKPRYPLVFELKSAVENLLQQCGVRNFQWKPGSIDEAPDFLHAGQWATLMVQGEMVGFVGSLHPKILDENKFREGFAIGEIEIDSLLAIQAKVLKIEPISKFPVVERDFAFLIPTNVSADKVARAIKKAAGPTAVAVDIFDVYQGAELPAGQRSVAFSLKIQAQNATLQENEIQEVQARVLQAVQEQFALSPRAM